MNSEIQKLLNLINFSTELNLARKSIGGEFPNMHRTTLDNTLFDFTSDISFFCSKI
uniref:Uncharacterized protein n=1 Tax=Lotus japonicus TaxID=34305 RepID=I3STE1_LOTJA|nr:unknown [Lotus japonicus]